MTLIKTIRNTLVISAGLLVSACFKSYEGKIYIDGSSSVYPLTEAVAEEYRHHKPDIRITVGVSGTGGGFKKFLRGETDISNASRPISPAELKESRENGIEFIEIPVCYDGMAVVVNPQNTFVSDITVAELHKIWGPESQGKVMRWNQVRDSWPDSPLKLYGAGTSSGTFDFFTEAINGRAKSSRGDYTASEDDNVLVQGISSDPNGLGYFGLAYYRENSDRLKLVGIRAQKGSPVVFPSDSTVREGAYQPLSRPEFIYVNKKAMDKPYVRDFLRFYIANAAPLAAEVGYVPLSEEIYRLCLLRVEKRLSGSMFENRSVVGANLGQLLTEDVKTDGAQ
ncbi:MAG TPA: PstS family phosphate ABC transporter substrate-binding protein [Parapedobacter sp.]|uniref:PstS family phosphate ABC transporter substrate-binding protein n=1 Tax=Parapedobacter sp. TaxID=1958893 RepID=UPI002B54C322|nr:PstS family phosphate ABC transporter substrate-binding protein [Parapedobacter sp.]HWK59682.1 PstS family phosphate ABC transporter substrate-binding protein [Parapedobacter sp.]